MGETGARTASKDHPQYQLAEVTAEGAPTTIPPTIEPVQVTRWMGERPWVHHIRGLNHELTTLTISGDGINHQAFVKYIGDL